MFTVFSRDQTCPFKDSLHAMHFADAFIQSVLKLCFLGIGPETDARVFISEGIIHLKNWSSLSALLPINVPGLELRVNE